MELCPAALVKKVHSSEVWEKDDATVRAGTVTQPSELHLVTSGGG